MDRAARCMTAVLGHVGGQLSQAGQNGETRHSICRYADRSRDAHPFGDMAIAPHVHRRAWHKPAYDCMQRGKITHKTEGPFPGQ